MFRILSALLVAALASTAAPTANAATIHYLIKGVIDSNVADGPPPIAVGEELALYVRVDPMPGTPAFNSTAYYGAFQATYQNANPVIDDHYGGSIYVSDRPARDGVSIEAFGNGWAFLFGFSADPGALADETVPDLVSLMGPGWTNGFRFNGGGAILEFGHITSIELLPTPIPAALPLFASALGGLWLVGRRRRTVAA